jgi:DNA-binding MarR family transcriptional regulator
MNSDEQRRTAMEIHMLGAIVTKKTILAMESDRVLVEAGISMSQFGMLRALRRSARTISELSRIMMVDPSTLVPVVDALERKGLAVRGRDPHDRRRVPISLTQRGAEIAAKHPMKGPLAAEDNPLLKSIAAMGPERAQQLLGLLREMVSFLPDGDEILQRVATRVRFHSPAESQTKEEE